jgi:hypothetical protein
VEAQAEYRRQTFKHVHLIPVGNRWLNMGEGEHEVEINGNMFKAVLRPELHFNQITRNVQQLAMLPCQGLIAEDGQSPDMDFCIRVPIYFGTGPILPGLFLVTEEEVVEGFDVILGKPWMIEVDQNFKNFEFDMESGSQEDENYGLVQEADIEIQAAQTFKRLPPDKEIGRWTSLVWEESSESDEEETDAQKRRHTKEIVHRPEKKMKSGHNNRFNYDMPSLGGAMAKAL